MFENPEFKEFVFKHDPNEEIGNNTDDVANACVLFLLSDLAAMITANKYQG